MSSCSQPPSETVIAVKTSKAWVLPPRPKPGRKPTTKERKRKSNKECDLQKKPEKIAVSPAPTQRPIEAKPSLAQPAVDHHHHHQQQQWQPKIVLGTTDQQLIEVGRHIKQIESENVQLKDRLLALIHDYKHLRVAVLSGTNSPLPGVEDTTARKRLYTELDPMHELISDMNELTHSADTPGWETIELPEGEHDLENENGQLLLLSEEINANASALFDFINLDDDEEEQSKAEFVMDLDKLDIEEEEEEEGADLHDLPGLLRTPLPLETDCESSLMTLLTRLTTVLTQNLLILLLHNEKKQSGVMSYSSALKDQPYQFFQLPAFGAGAEGFTFDQSLGPLEKLSKALKEDQYNMVTDFLEEQLLDNNIDYYTSTRDY